MTEDAMTELENRLRNRTDDEPSTVLRERVMKAVANELATPRRGSSALQWDGRYWAAAAAAVLIVMNLSLGFASRDAYLIRPRGNSDQLHLELQSIRQLETQEEGLFQ